MKKLWKLVALIGVGVAALGGVAFAASNSTVNVSGTSNHSVYKAGQSVTITGTVNGDIVCVGQTIDIDATVNGDVVCAGQSVTVDGTVHGNVRVAGQTVNIGAKIDHNASLAAQTATLQNNASVDGDVGLAAQSANVNGSIGRDLTMAVHTATLTNSVGRNVDAHANNRLQLADGANVKGNLTYTSPNTLQKAAGAVVGGKVAYHKATVHHHHIAWGGIGIGVGLFLSLTFLIFALVLVALFPQTFRDWNRVAARRIWIVLLTGFLAMFIIPAVVLVLVITVIGWPLAFFFSLLWILALLLSGPLAAFFVGSLIFRRDRHPVLMVLVGSIVLGIISLIPILGWIVDLLAIWFGTGSALVNLRATYRRPEYATKPN
ncbi:MAG TPA: polymer-forming cytoskeletal protein [Verrucomicrobiae bacterium]|nr:polymer-forming cytoskeletal protein [Verrucomicrobiae bacterium]